MHFNLPLFGDWWQHNQSEYKFCRNWQNEPFTLAWMLTIIQCWHGLPLNPSSPFVPPLICYYFFFVSPFEIKFAPLFGDWWQHNQSKYKFCKNWQIEPLTLAWMLTIIQCWLSLPLNPSFPLCFSTYLLLLLFLPLWNQSCCPFGWYSFLPYFDPNFSPFGIKWPKKALQNNIAQREKLVA